MIHKACKWCKSDLPRSCLCPILWFAAVIVPAIASYFARQHAAPFDRVQCLPDNSNSNCHYPVRNLSDPTAETSTCGYPDPTAENATRDYGVRNFFDSIANRSATCGHCVWNLSDSGSDHSASARNVSDSTAGRSASRDYSMLNLSESVCLLCPGPGPARSASQDLSCSICPKGLQCSASQDLFASICPKGLQRSASQDLFASICPKDPQCSASQDLFASICPKDPHAPHSPDENRSECLWNLPDSKVDQSTIENPWACLQRLPYHIAYLSQILHATRTPLGYVLLLEVPHWLSSAKSSEKTIKTEPDLILGRNCHLLLQSIDSIEELSYLQNANISSNAVKFEATISLIPCFLPPVHKRSHISLPIHKSSS